MPRVLRRACTSTCTSAKHHAVKMATLAIYAGHTGVFGGETQNTSSKAKCGSISVPVDENGAVTNKKQVVYWICDRSLANTHETQRTCFFTSKPTIQRNTVK